MQNEYRRQVLKLGLTAAGAMMLPGLKPALADTKRQLVRTIPSSGEIIPAMGLGTFRTFDVGSGESELVPLREVVRSFVERGGTMVDSSPMYGRAERVVGELVTDLNIGDRIFFATKVWTPGKSAGKSQMEDSFRLMATDHIDLELDL